MRKLTKTTLVFALSVVAMFSCVLGLMLNGKTVNAATIEVTQVEEGQVTDIAGTSFEMSNVQIRGEGNGIRFIADAKGVVYSDVVYGMVIIPSDRISEEAPLNTENLFGENAKYTFDKEDGSGLPFAAKFEASAENVASLGGYLRVSLLDFAGDDINMDLTAVSYLKAVNEKGELVYDVKEGSVESSMYAEAVEALENPDVPAENKVALLDAYIGEASEEKYEAFAGNYTNTYKFGTDKTVTKRDLTAYTKVMFKYDGTTAGLTNPWFPHAGHNAIDCANYKLYNNNTLVITEADKITFGEYEEGKFEIAEEKNTKVDVATLYSKINGLYKNNSLGADTFALSFKGYNETLGAYTGQTYLHYYWGFTYEFVPITENFGKIDTAYTQKDQQAGGSLFDYGVSVVEIYYVYDGTNITLRVGTAVNASRDWRTTYNHFIDLSKNGSEFTSATYTQLAQTYTDETNTLVLSGLTDLKKGVVAGESVTDGFKGGVGTWGGNTITYSLIKLNETSGKIFFDMSNTPSTFSVSSSNIDWVTSGVTTKYVHGDYKKTSIPAQFCQGDYVIAENGDIEITFTYNGETYTVNYVAPKEVDQSVYDEFAGTYSDAYTFNADKTVDKKDLTSYIHTEWRLDGQAGKEGNIVNNPTYHYAGHHAVDSGSYKLLDNGVIEITFGNDTVYGTYEISNALGSFTVSEKTNSEVDVEKLYTAINGQYYNSNYTAPAGGSYKYGLKFGGYSNTYGAYSGNLSAYYNWTFTYEFVPITANFGKVDTVIRDKSQSTNSYQSLYDYGYAVAEIYYVYDGTKLSLVMGDSVDTARPLNTAYHHFVDISKDGTEYTTATYTQLTKTYTDGTNTLVLSGLTDLKKGVVAGESVTGGFKGGVGTWGENTITYSLIKLDETSGKIFLDMADKPAGLTATKVTNLSIISNNYVRGEYTRTSIPARYVIGDYTIADNGDITITFAYSGTTYTVTSPAA